MDYINYLRKLASHLTSLDSGSGDAAAINWAVDEIERLWAARVAAIMAKTRLDDFADKANAGQVHYSARELKRKIWAAFADFDALEQSAPAPDGECPDCGEPRGVGSHKDNCSWWNNRQS